MTDTEWFNLKKTDAWVNNLKQALKHNSQSARPYDLGYNEERIRHLPTIITTIESCLKP